MRFSAEAGIPTLALHYRYDRCMMQGPISAIGMFDDAKRAFGLEPSVVGAINAASEKADPYREPRNQVQILDKNRR